jgi:hypothetical protein
MAEPTVFGLEFIFFCGTGVWTRGLMLAMQVLYQQPSVIFFLNLPFAFSLSSHDKRCLLSPRQWSAKKPTTNPITLMWDDLCPLLKGFLLCVPSPPSLLLIVEVKYALIFPQLVIYTFFLVTWLVATLESTACIFDLLPSFSCDVYHIWDNGKLQGSWSILTSFAPPWIFLTVLPCFHIDFSSSSLSSCIMMYGKFPSWELFFAVLGFELKAYTLSHSANPFLWWVSHYAGFEPWSLWSLPPYRCEPPAAGRNFFYSISFPEVLLGINYLRVCLQIFKFHVFIFSLYLFQRYIFLDCQLFYFLV